MTMLFGYELAVEGASEPELFLAISCLCLIMHFSQNCLFHVQTWIPAWTACTSMVLAWSICSGMGGDYERPLSLCLHFLPSETPSILY